ncbi:MULTISPECIES: ABC transporter permease [unclassified Nocardiopsis]|jgi:peptide/nickel transport system permease protein|uniref:ABC transporter permease n=1 Tax=unclassified Nocardiopsis TaxID=2649073 RepID=UPI00066D965C|nr:MULTISPECIES: ABC transporter permease [unclassified Nocardiopsis]MBQ1082417.1 ABC transporter permease [Nocardiopsis sp. B62]
MSENGMSKSARRDPAKKRKKSSADQTQLQTILIRFTRHRPAMISLVLLGLIALFAFVGPFFWTWDHTVYREIPSNQPPSGIHPLGTSAAGHDVLGQLMRGAQQTLKVAFTVSLLSTAVGSVWGATAGYYGGRVDAFMMRVVDIFLIVPLLVAAAAIAGNSGAGTSWSAIALIISIFSWATIARVVRGVVLSLREQEFVEAARASGASAPWIILRHLLPNAAGPIIVAATLLVAVAILAEAGMSFLGLGIQLPDISLGQMIGSARTAVSTRPWLFYPPGVLLVLICLTINFIGDGLRDALDPRQTRVRR